MRKALVIGIDHYNHISPLFGCVNDAYSVKAFSKDTRTAQLIFLLG